MPRALKSHADRQRPDRRRRDDQARPSASARGYGRRWQKIRLMYLARHPMCELSGCNKAAVDVHHIIPRRDGGSDAFGNLQALCHAHHSAATRRETNDEMR